jgi:hypothetical protein
VLSDPGLVAPLCRRVDVENMQPSVEQLADRRASPRASSFVDLAEKPGSNLLGLITSAGPRRHDLTEVEPPLGDRVDPGVDADTEGTRRQLINTAALSLSPLARGRPH